MSRDIFQAVSANDTATITALLLQRGADPNAQGQSGEAPLHLTSDFDMVKLLLARGGKPHLADHFGTTPIDWALNDNLPEIFLLLAQAAPELGSPNYQLLKVSHDRKLIVEATYDEQFRSFRVITLGWTERAERCFAYQVTGTPDHPEPGLRCFAVDKFTEVSLGAPYTPEPEPEPEPEDERDHTPCVAMVDETPYSQESPNKAGSKKAPYRRN